MSLSAKDKVLSTAARLFYAQGYHQTGINQIIEESKVAKASFYYHFPSKESLAIAYLGHTREVLQAEMDMVLAADSGPGAKILALFERLYLWREDPGYNGCVFLKISNEFGAAHLPVQEQVVLSKNAFRAFFVTLIQELEGQTGLGLSGQALADVLVVLFDGASTEALAVGGTWPLDAACVAVKGLLGLNENSRGQNE